MRQGRQVSRRPQGLQGPQRQQVLKLLKLGTLRVASTYRPPTILMTLNVCQWTTNFWLTLSLTMTFLHLLHSMPSSKFVILSIISHSLLFSFCCCRCWTILKFKQCSNISKRFNLRYNIVFWRKPVNYPFKLKVTRLFFIILSNQENEARCVWPRAHRDQRRLRGLSTVETPTFDVSKVGGNFSLFCWTLFSLEQGWGITCCVSNYNSEIADSNLSLFTNARRQITGRMKIVHGCVVLITRLWVNGLHTRMVITETLSAEA